MRRAYFDPDGLAQAIRILIKKQQRVGDDAIGNYPVVLPLDDLMVRAIVYTFDQTIPGWYAAISQDRLQDQQDCGRNRLNLYPV